jgi:hypothetical protein
VVYDGSWVAKPKASFVLDKNAQYLVYQWLKSPCFPDGYTSNISMLVYEDCRLYGMKSHDCHVIMKTLLPLAYWYLLSKGYEMHSRRSVTFLKIYAPTSYRHNTWRGLEWITFRQSENLRWYFLHLNKWLVIQLINQVFV